MSGFQYPNSGPSFVPEYQMSGLPFAITGSVSSSVVQIEFPYVTKFVTVANKGSQTLIVGFTANGAASTSPFHFTLNVSQSYTAEWRMKDLFLLSQAGTSSYEVIAGLTVIKRLPFPTLTASAATGSVTSAGSDFFGYAPGLG